MNQTDKRDRIDQIDKTVRSRGGFDGTSRSD
jgi:hypothetical protein